MSPCDWTAAGTTQGIPGLQAASGLTWRQTGEHQCFPVWTCLCPNPTGSTATWGGCQVSQGHPGRQQCLPSCEAGARSCTKNTPPSPVFTCALLSLRCPYCPHQSALECQCIIALLDRSTAVASDPRMAGRVRLLNESKRTDVEEYQSYKGNPTPPCICGVRCCDHDSSKARHFQVQGADSSFNFLGVQRPRAVNIKTCIPQ